MEIFSVLFDMMLNLRFFVIYDAESVTVSYTASVIIIEEVDNSLCYTQNILIL